MKIQRNDCGNNGFTLVELLVALLISGILMATVSSVLLMSQKIYTRGGDISYKEGTVTNTETNLQNELSVATGVTLASAPKTVADNEESYNIGFKNDGTCEEVIISLNVDSAGNPALVGGVKQYSKIVNAIPQISEIGVMAVQQEKINQDGTTTKIDVYNLNYELVPIDATMSTLGGGTVMNNINKTNKNIPSQAKLMNGTKLKVSGDEMHYLVLTFKEITGGTIDPVPGSNINDSLKVKGVNVGSWDKMIAYAAASKNGGYLLSQKGSVYTDSTGTYVTGDGQYIGVVFAEGNPTAQTYYTNMGGENSVAFIKISETTRIITEDDYETDPSLIAQSHFWKVGKYPKLGDLYLYKGAYYIWQNSYSDINRPIDATQPSWVKLVSAPVEFQ